MGDNFKCDNFISGILKQNLTLDLHLDVYELISFKLGMVIVAI